METAKVQLTEEEKKRNRERLAEMLLERVAENKREFEETKNDPKFQELIKTLIEKNKANKNDSSGTL